MYNATVCITKEELQKLAKIKFGNLVKAVVDVDREVKGGRKVGYLIMQHSALQDSSWNSLTLLEQLANIGSEVFGALKWSNKNSGYSDVANNRALKASSTYPLQAFRQSTYRAKIQELLLYNL